MANADNQPKNEGRDEEVEAPASGKKKVFLLGGGALIVPALAYALALMAVPKEVERPRFEGPFVKPMTEAKVQVNLGDQKDRFFVFEHNVVYEAYGEAYYAQRMADPLYLAYLKDALIGLAASKTAEQVYAVAYEPSFREEIRMIVDPLLFPVHVGAGQRASDPDPKSGLAPGTSIMRSTMRGAFHEHVIHLDDQQRTISIDDGPTVKYDGHEADLELYTEMQEVVYLDLRRVKRDFRGDLNVGVKGRAIRILKLDALIQ